jgi:hypothetical protein
MTSIVLAAHDRADVGTLALRHVSALVLLCVGASCQCHLEEMPRVDQLVRGLGTGVGSALDESSVPVERVRVALEGRAVESEQAHSATAQDGLGVAVRDPRR